MKTRILIIDDDPAFCEGLKTNLESESYMVSIESDGEKGISAVLKARPDIIILDIILPTINGFDVCKSLRIQNINTPIIMLTAKNEEADKVLGLELGADDYVTKPFSIRELIARIRVIIRRKNQIEETEKELRFGDVKINFKKMESHKSGTKINMSLKEFEIMKYFAASEGTVITRDMLLDKVWGYENFPTTRTVDNYVLMLRKKIEKDPSNPKHLTTVYAAGYKFAK